MNRDQLLKQLKPFVAGWIDDAIASITVSGGSGGAPSPHGLNSSHHTGTLAASQYPDALLTDGSRQLTGNLAVAGGITIDGTDISAHVADADAHHARQHLITSASDHTVTGSTLDVVGLTGTDTLGILTPSANPGAASALLKSDSSGILTLVRLNLTTTTNTRSLSINSSGITNQPAAAITTPATTGVSDGFALAAFESGKSFARYLLYSDGKIGWGPGTATRDTYLSRAGTSQLLVTSDAATGAADLMIAGKLGTGVTSTPAAQLQSLATTEQLRLNYDASNYASFTVGSGGNLTLAPTGDLVLDPTGNDVLPNVAYDLNLGSLQKKYLTLHAAELWVETLVAQDTIATIGGRILVGPTTVLTRDLSTVATTIYVKHNEMASGDRAYLEADGKVEFLAITSGATPQAEGDYAYTVTRNLDGSGANLWYAGDAVFNTGTTGDGFIDLYSLRSVKSATQYGPTIVGNVRNSATYNDWTEVWAVGNLNGVYGYGADTYGAAFGKYSAGNYVTIDPTNGVRFFDDSDAVRAQLTSSTWTLGVTTADHVSITTSGVQLKDGATVKVDLQTDGDLFIGTDVSAAGTTYLSVFANAQTYNTEAVGAGDMLIGDNSASKANILWDASAGQLLFRGGQTAQAYVDTDGTITAGSGSVELDSSGILLRSDQADTGGVSYLAWGSSGIVRDDALIGAYIGGGETMLWATANESGAADEGVVKLSARSSGAAAAILRLESANTGQTAYGMFYPVSATSFGLTVGALASPNAELDVRGDVIATGGLNIGTATGAAAGQLKASAGAEFRNTIRSIMATGSSSVRFDKYGSAPIFIGYRANGSEGTPTQVLANETLMSFLARGYHSGGAFATNDAVRMRFFAAEAFTSGARGSYVTFDVTPTGSTTAAEELRIDADGLGYRSDLRPYRNSTYYTAYALVPLTTKLTSTSWDGDAKSSNAGTPTLIDLSVVFGAPAGIKAIAARLAVQSGTVGRYLALGGVSGTGISALVARCQVASQYIDISGVVPCNASGDVYYETDGVDNAYLEIHGYWI